MRILLTNDDGLRAPGIESMYDALTDATGALGGPLRHEGAAPGSTTVLPVAPLTVQSATSHGVTFHQPLMVSEIQVNPRMNGIAVDGRPADCVKLALSSIWPERFPQHDGKDRSRPDLLVSGMNAGANCGINVIYSGTVAAALEGAFLGIPSIAVSLRLGVGRPRFDVAGARARHAIDLVMRAGLLEPHGCLSINIPLTEEPWPEPGAPGTVIGRLRRPKTNGAVVSNLDVMPPVRVCAMNVHGLVDQYERRVSPSGDVYYWAAGQGLDFHDTDPGSDVDLLLQGCITVTPLRYDLTEAHTVSRWRAAIEGAR